MYKLIYIKKYVIICALNKKGDFVMFNVNAFNQLISSLVQRKKALDILGVKTMGEKDFKVADKMASMIPSVMIKSAPTGSIISQDEAFSKSYSYLQVIDSIYSDRALSIKENAKVYNAFDDINAFSTNIAFSVDDESMKVNKDSASVEYFRIPKRLDELSPLWLAHEHIHCLKETNYSEYIDGLIFGDVIPMFLELLLTDNVDKRLVKPFITNRLFLLKNEYNTTQQMKYILSGQKDLYAVYASSAMQYLNSFYYTLQLYYMYMLDEAKILSEVSDVLDHKKTTRMMLQELGLLDSFQEKTAENLLGKVLTKMATK